jgi:hypothetical protein
MLYLWDFYNFGKKFYEELIALFPFIMIWEFGTSRKKH